MGKLKSPQLYLYGLAAWLSVTNFGHTALGIPDLLAMAEDPNSPRYTGFRALLESPRGGAFDYNSFDLFFLGMLALTLFLLYGAVVALWVAWNGSGGAVRQFCRINFVFWAGTLAAAALFYPVDNMVLIVSGAVLLSGLALWRAEAASGQG